MLGPMIAWAKAAECDSAITADEALKAEDSQYAAQTPSDFDFLLDASLSLLLASVQGQRLNVQKL